MPESTFIRTYPINFLTAKSELKPDEGLIISSPGPQEAVKMICFQGKKTLSQSRYHNRIK